MKDISLWIVVITGSGVLLYIGIMVWWKVIDELLKLFRVKKRFARWVFTEMRKKNDRVSANAKDVFEKKVKE